MNRTEHLFTILGEEAVEVAQRTSKINRFGVRERQKGHKMDNTARLYEEYAQLQAVVEMLENEGVLKRPSKLAMQRFKDAKKLNVELYLALSRKQGTLQESVREVALRQGIIFEKLNLSPRRRKPKR